MTTRTKPATATSRLNARIAELSNELNRAKDRIEYLAEQRASERLRVSEHMSARENAENKVATLEYTVNQLRIACDEATKQAQLWKGIALGMDHQKATAIIKAINPPPVTDGHTRPGHDFMSRL